MSATVLPGAGSDQCNFMAAAGRHEAYRSSWQDNNVVPKSHVWPDQCRPSLAHDQYSDAEIPVIDLACCKLSGGKGMIDELGEIGEVRAARQRVMAQVREACLEWGFFQIRNHNVSLELIERVREQAFRFFNLPMEVKKTVGKAPGEFTGFGHATVKPGDVQPWAEGFYLNDFGRVDHVARTVWPGEYNKDFAAAYREYDEAMKVLCKQLMDLIIEGLHLTDTDHFEKYVNKESTGLFRWNYYPACPEPHKTLGMNVHTDFTLLTVLHLGAVGGLQIQKDGNWVAVKPRQDAFAVNIGDMLQVLTNGLYKSVPHRAVVNRSDARLSLAYLFLPPSDVDVVASSELVEDGTKPLYSPFKLEYYAKVKQTHFSNTLDHFAHMP